MNSPSSCDFEPQPSSMANSRSDSAPPTPPRLEALSVTKRFGPLVALDDVSLTLEPGSFHALAWRERGRQEHARQMHHGLLPRGRGTLP